MMALWRAAICQRYALRFAIAHGVVDAAPLPCRQQTIFTLHTRYAMLIMALVAMLSYVYISHDAVLIDKRCCYFAKMMLSLPCLQMFYASAPVRRHARNRSRYHGHTSREHKSSARRTSSG